MGLSGLVESGSPIGYDGWVQWVCLPIDHGSGLVHLALAHLAPSLLGLEDLDSGEFMTQYCSQNLGSVAESWKL